MAVLADARKREKIGESNRLEQGKSKMKSCKGRAKAHLGRWRKRALLAAAALFLAILAGNIWTIYYDLNDDSLMAEILSGSYTGTPALRNIQSYYPLTVIMGGLYRLGRTLDGLLPGQISAADAGFWSEIDWYGGFLLLLQYGCLALIAGRLLERLQHVRKRIAGLGLLLLAAAGLLVYHYIYLQYSVTVGILGATAAFLFLTMEVENGKSFVRRKDLLLPILLVLVGFLLRSEMMLFVGPFVALAFLVRMTQLCRGDAGHKEFDVRNFLQCSVLTLALTLGGMGICVLGNQLGYHSKEWKSFQELFDARTNLYDFQKLPTYEENTEFYESIGLDSAKAQLITNYNYGLEKTIDAKALQCIADYAGEKAAAQESSGTRLRNAIWDYRTAMQGGGEYAGEPYPLMAAVLYTAALAAAMCCGMQNRVVRRNNTTGKAAGEISGARDSSSVSKIPCEKESAAVCGMSDEWCGKTVNGRLHCAGSILLIVALFLLRSALFLYLYYNHRPVVRLTHSIYLCEAVFLLWITGRAVLQLWEGENLLEMNHGEKNLKEKSLQKECLRKEYLRKECLQKERFQKKHLSENHFRKGVPLQRGIFKAAACVIALAAAGGLFCGCVWQVKETAAEQQRREEVNEPYQELQSYVREHAENIYLLDVYSTVDFSDRLGEAGTVPTNMDLLGGWACKSPLELSKLSSLGVNISEVTGEDGTGTAGILEAQGNVYAAAEIGADMTWLVNYYQSIGESVAVEAVDFIGESWVIYSVTKMSE